MCLLCKFEFLGLGFCLGVLLKLSRHLNLGYLKYVSARSPVTLWKLTQGRGSIRHEPSFLLQRIIHATGWKLVRATQSLWCQGTFPFSGSCVGISITLIMGNLCLLVFTGESSFQGLLGGAAFRLATASQTGQLVFRLGRVGAAQAPFKLVSFTITMTLGYATFGEHSEGVVLSNYAAPPNWATFCNGGPAFASNLCPKKGDDKLQLSLLPGIGVKGSMALLLSRHCEKWGWLACPTKMS